MSKVDGPLNGVKVLDLTHIWAGPLGVRFLADLGAQVVRVEAPGSRGPQVFPSSPLGGWLSGQATDEPWNDNAIFAKLMRNRQSLCIDLKTSVGRAAFLQLVAKADIVIENFSARAMPSLDLGYEVLKQANPKIIYIAMPGFGLSGPLRDRVAFGPTVEAMSGLTEVMGYGPEQPRNTAMALLDPIAATHAVAGAMTALQQRRNTGEGCHIEMSLHEGGVAYSGPWLVDLQLGGSPVSLGNGHPNMLPHGIFRCAGEDQWLALACGTDSQWQALCGLLSSQSLSPQWSLAERRLHAESIDQAIGSWVLQRNKHQASQLLQAAGVPAGAVNTVPDMVADEQTQARSFFVPYERYGVPMPGTPIKLPDLDTSQWTPCPRLGADNSAVLADWLDYSEEQVQTLVDQGVLHQRPPF